MRLIKKLEDIYAAVAFAEEGEVETARRILREEDYTHQKLTENKHTTLVPKGQAAQVREQPKRLWKRFEDAIGAIYFAKAGELEIAKEMLSRGKSLSKESDDLKHKADLTLSTIDDLTSMAITFAEAGEFKMAWELLNEAEDSVKKVIRVYQKNLNDMVLTPKATSS